jgi:urease accessory protein
MFAATLRSDQQGKAAPLPRSFGAVDLHFRRRDDVIDVARAFQQGIMRVRFPNVARGLPPEAVLINTAGGLTGGDLLSIAVTVPAAAASVVTTQAHEKVYRSAAGDAVVTAEIALEGDAALDWLPQPTILFDGARLQRQTNVSLSGTATFLGVEAVIFGRTAMNETVRSGSLNDTWKIVRDGRLIHRDCFALNGDIAAALARPSVLAGHLAMATIRYVAPDAETRLEAMRELLEDDGAASAWNGMLLARIVTADGYRLGLSLTRILTSFRGRTLPAAWAL